VKNERWANAHLSFGIYAELNRFTTSRKEPLKAPQPIKRAGGIWQNRSLFILSFLIIQTLHYDLICELPLA